MANVKRTRTLRVNLTEDEDEKLRPLKEALGFNPNDKQNSGRTQAIAYLINTYAEVAARVVGSYDPIADLKKFSMNLDQGYPPTNLLPSNLQPLDESVNALATTNEAEEAMLAMFA